MGGGDGEGGGGDGEGGGNDGGGKKRAPQSAQSVPETHRAGVPGYLLESEPMPSSWHSPSLARLPSGPVHVLSHNIGGGEGGGEGGGGEGGGGEGGGEGGGGEGGGVEGGGGEGGGEGGGGEGGGEGGEK